MIYDDLTYLYLCSRESEREREEKICIDKLIEIMNSTWIFFCLFLYYLFPNIL